MKNLLSIIISSMLLVLTNTAFAYDNGDGTHTVEAYTKSDGTFVQEHEAANPGSGIHCHGNVCS